MGLEGAAVALREQPAGPRHRRRGRCNMKYYNNSAHDDVDDEDDYCYYCYNYVLYVKCIML